MKQDVVSGWIRVDDGRKGVDDLSGVAAGRISRVVGPVDELCKYTRTLREEKIEEGESGG
jgi:hypothetical protein